MSFKNKSGSFELGLKEIIMGVVIVIVLFFLLWKILSESIGGIFQ